MTVQSLKDRYGFEHPFVTDPLVRRAGRFLKGMRGKVLDIGCGEGADSVYYAHRGFRVTAIDRNKEYLTRFRRYRRDHDFSYITILERDALKYGYPAESYDVINCILVLCCMKRSQFERMVVPLKRAVKPGGLMVISSRNELDPEMNDYRRRGRPIETNTYRHLEDCCRFVYFIERGRLREVFSGFDILYYYEGEVPCKYNEHPVHGDSWLIGRRKR